VDSLIYQIKNRKWYGGEEFGGDIVFDTRDSIAEINKLRDAFLDLNKGVAAFTESMSKFNTEVGSFKGLGQLIKQLEDYIAAQEGVIPPLKEGTKAGLRADEVANQRIKTLLRINTVLDKNGKLQKLVRSGLDATGNTVQVVADAENNLLSVRIKQAQTTEARIRAENKLADQMKRAQNELNLLQQQKNKGQLEGLIISKKINTASNRTQEIWNATTTDGQKLTATLTSVNGQLIGVASSTKPLNESLDTAKDRVQKLTLSWQTFLRVVVVQVIHRAVSKFIQEVKRATEDAIEFSIRISEIRTISQQNQLTTDRWAEGLRELSDAFGFDLLDQAEAAYQTLSNQVAKGAEAFGFLKSANELALVGVSDAAASVQFLSAVQNAFNLTLDDTANIAAQTFKTIELGRVRLDEMANTIGQSAVPAANLGLSFTDLAAAITTVTIRGVPFEKAQTAIRNILLKLIRPTAEMTKLFREWGVVSGEAAIAAFGFGGVLAKIEERTKGSSSELGKIFGRIRAISGAMVFAGRGLKTFENNWKELQEAQASYEVALKETLTNTGREIRIEVNKIKNFFTEEIGRDLIDTIKFVNDNVLSLSDSVKLFASVITVFLAPAIGLAAAALVSLNLAIIVTPFGALVAGLTAAGIGLKLAFDSVTNSYDEAIKEADDFYNESVKKLKDQTTARLKIIESGYEVEFRLAKAAIAQVQSVLSKQLDTQVGLDKELANGLKLAYQDVIKSIQAGIKDLNDILKDSEKTIEQTTKNIADLKRELASNILREQLDSAVDVQAKQRLLIAEAQKQFVAAISITGTDQQSQRNARAAFDITKKLLEEAAKLQSDTAEKNESNEKEVNKLRERGKKAATDLENLRLKAADKRLTFENKIDARIRAGARISITSVNGEIKSIQSKDKAVLKAQRDQERFERENNERIRKLLTVTANITQEIKERQPIEIEQLEISKAQNALIKQRIEFEKELAEAAKQATKEAKEETERREKNLKLIQEQSREISKLKVKDLIGVDDVDEQIVNLLKALKDVDKARETIEKASVKDPKTAIVAQEQLAKKEAQIEETLKKKLLEQELETVRKTIKLQEEGLKNRIKVQKEAELKLRGSEPAARTDLISTFAKLGPDFAKFRADLAPFLKDPTAKGAAVLIKTIEDFERSQQELAPFFRGQRSEEGVAAISTFEDAVLRLFRITRDNNAVSELKKLTEASKKQVEESRKAFDKTFGLTEQADRDRNDHLKKIEKAQTVDIPALLAQIRDKVGPLGRAAGGDVPGSTDTVPAMLTPGEFVMNARSARKFHTQLVAMNAGIQPFQGGGSVTNVGDVNINMQSSGNEAYDVTKVGKLLQRQIRRKTLRF